MTKYCFADAVASKVISYFKTCPPNGKPKSTAEAASEFTVLASIVATRKRSDTLGDSPTEMTVISIATGTKCAGKCREDVDGCILCDSHAEVLARRGLVRWLLKCLIAAQKDVSICTQDSFPLCLVSSSETEKGLTNLTQVAYLQIKGEWEFHLYISDSPCGDATIYTRKVNEGCIAGFTGAKLVRSESNREQVDKEQSITACMTDDRAPTANICNWEREDIQEIGAVRTKSGRSDVQVQNRTTSMSCSDKICRWSSLGLQGALLSLFVKPFYLTSVVVELDQTARNREDQHLALVRALQTRLFLDQESKEHSKVNTTDSSHCFSISHEGDEKDDKKPHRCKSTHTPEVYITSSCDSANTSYKFSKSNADYINAELASELPHEKSSDVVKLDDGKVESVPTSGQSESKRSSQQRLKADVRKIPSCGTSVNWVLDVPSPSNPKKDEIEAGKSRLKACSGGTVEVTQADTGALQGCTKASIGQIESSSRLSKKWMSHLFTLILQKCFDSTDPSTLRDFLVMKLTECSALNASILEQSTASNDSTKGGPEMSAESSTSDNCSAESSSVLHALLAKPYSWWKRISPTYSECRMRFLSNGPFKLWLCDDPCLNGFPLQIPANSLGTTRKKSMRPEKNPTQGQEIDMSIDSYKVDTNDLPIDMHAAKKIKLDDLHDTDSEIIPPAAS